MLTHARKEEACVVYLTIDVLVGAFVCALRSWESMYLWQVTAFGHGKRLAIIK